MESKGTKGIKGLKGIKGTKGTKGNNGNPDSKGTKGNQGKTRGKPQGRYLDYLCLIPVIRQASAAQRSNQTTDSPISQRPQGLAPRKGKARRSSRRPHFESGTCHPMGLVQTVLPKGSIIIHMSWTRGLVVERKQSSCTSIRCRLQQVAGR